MLTNHWCLLSLSVGSLWKDRRSHSFLSLLLVHPGIEQFLGITCSNRILLYAHLRLNFRSNSVNNPAQISQHTYTGHSHFHNYSNTQTAATTHLRTGFPLFVQNSNQLELTSSRLLSLFYTRLYGVILIRAHFWPPSARVTSWWNRVYWIAKQ